MHAVYYIRQIFCLSPLPLTRIWCQIVPLWILFEHSNFSIRLQPHSSIEVTSKISTSILPFSGVIKNLHCLVHPCTTCVYTMMWMLHALWLVVAHDLLEYRYMDDVTGNLFSLFCSTWHAVLKMFVRLFRIEASESFGKSLAGAIYKEEKWRNGDQKGYWLLDNA